MRERLRLRAICFEDEAGQGLRPPKGRTWAPRGARPVVKVRGAGGGRVSIAGVACYRPGDRPHLFYKLLVYRRHKGEAKGFTWTDYRDLILAAHRALSAPLVWCWDNLNVHLAPELADFAEESKAWLRVYRLPTYAPDLNPAEGITPRRWRCSGGAARGGRPARCAVAGPLARSPDPLVLVIRAQSSVPLVAAEQVVHLVLGEFRLVHGPS